VRRTTATTAVAAVGVVGPDGVGGASYVIVTMPSPARSPAAEAAAS